MKYPSLKNYIDGKFVDSGDKSIDVISPLDGTIISTVPISGAEAIDNAVTAAQKAFPSWSAKPIKERAQIFFKYKTLLEKNLNELAELIHEENGKTISESVAEIEKSIEVTEFACSLEQLAAGEVMEVSNGVECRVERYPVGVVGCITPFNFPLMVPNWTIPNALVLGNCMILKPSEHVPLSANRIADLLKEAGLRYGVFNVVHGAKDTVEAICDHPGIQAVSFVGSTKVAKLVYTRSTSNLKRALTLGGAKNHLDGRNCKVSGKENGFYVGPTVIDNVKPGMKIAKEEVFGPVIAIIRADTVDSALSIQKSSLYGNAASVFTQSGGMARYISERASAGMIGVNIGVPVPREPFSFGGWNESKFGTCDITGKSSIEFWTKLKKTTVKWNPESQINWMS